MSPNFALQTVILGATVVFAVLIIGFLVILDRTRLTNIVRTRRFLEPRIEENIFKAFEKYEKMNNT